MTEKEIRQLVKDETKKYIANELSKEVKKMVSDKNSPTRDEIRDMIKRAMTIVHKYMWMRKEIWQNDINNL